METWTSDSDQDLEWGSDDEVVDEGTRHSSVPPSGPSQPPVSSHEAIAGQSNKACEEGPSRPSLVREFIVMGFKEDMVVKAIQENGEGDTEAILETLLTYKAIEKAPSDHENSPNDCSLSSDRENTDEDLCDMDDFEDEEFAEDLSEKDRKLLILVEMGFPTDKASSAIDRCGPNASLLELADSIHAAQMAEESDCHLRESRISDSTEEGTYVYDSQRGRKRRSPEETNYKRKRLLSDSESMICLPKPMVGFGLPNQRMTLANRKIPEAATGPPYFYYENVALAPKGAWETISRFLYDIEPEFVDSKYFCAAARKRGYVHNLPIHNRFLLHPTPPKTIQEAFPVTKKWWPSWDYRRQFNCLQTCVASAKLTERIRTELEKCGDPPPERIQKYVLEECRRWNLVWVGRHKVAPLEPDEIEMLLGFPRDHTRGGGISRMNRYKSLGNSFQVDTVAYHLSVLKDMFPNGITVLSLFSGIGGAEVALHQLGIHMKTVVSVEISDVNRNILKSWWEQTNQTGELIDLSDVQELNGDKLEQMINTFGGFDLVIGGSPCNNLSGSNRYSRDGLEGKHSSLFYDYFRILDLVKCIMGKNF
ncbi:DNA (cytosine-5)-methyltransferase DRM2-like isoform X1 [Phoenix dactylifera]|uniref:DNA (cytosine-5-)-methyltransferase n=2 Tax=Phoenix dactylifera TaxID=42345 RepID=A0A8B9A2S4_PHODC|nr:DNA (cytosine-5)-methyltransferase DRM2-like isoform X1 [Phoenix dactylifera]